ncbi:PHP domain-containing protein [Acidaminobacter sp. JC074]|uniref:PHP domain-containing protein n=1 Tax=Acidaminobacter sp. JC074 TaxID=2530199 RepID=UPI001F0E5D55|nr:PHP domain-containing protein [Acidaminobacter sp. JC074]MCH4888985.1 PHP domain-containing protein [Acidaminobacter sp. JC074]
MKIIADYHTHTTFSHGSGSIEDNVKAAISKGLKTIAISDHGPGHAFYGIKKSRYKEMREEIDRLNELYPDIQILLGLEANFMSVDGTIDVDDDMLEIADIIMCGYHFGSSPRKLLMDLKMHAYAILSKHSKGIYEKSKKLNTIMLINAMNRYDLTAITHPGAKGPIDVLAVAKVASEKNVALEVNAKHGHLTVEEIKIALQTDVKFILGSDAHDPENVGVFTESLNRCLEAGIPISRILNAEEAS